ncbi:hypothetical protein [Saccharicrinis sp. 156]|uniref:hypothetical protein n=1 Tax=Saccharicrinis sp. 156 TaxID=3417574 RepID=UPI003D35226D
MITHIDRTPENKSQSAANKVSQKQYRDASSFTFVDHRPEAISLRSLQEVANKSGQVSQLSALQEMANLSVRANKSDKFPARDLPIQRIAAPGSDPMLLTHYNFLMNSATFQDLANRITMNGDIPINLVDGTVGQNISYDEESHTIYVPVRDEGGSFHSNDQIRGDILWEMHNAHNKGSLKRANMRYPEELPANAKPDEKRELLYKKANYALSVEWIEWSKS